jgi:hypothetical protein
MHTEATGDPKNCSGSRLCAPEKIIKMILKKSTGSREAKTVIATNDRSKAGTEIMMLLSEQHLKLISDFKESKQIRTSSGFLFVLNIFHSTIRYFNNKRFKKNNVKSTVER